MQVSNYLGSDASRWAREFWAMATRTRSNVDEHCAIAMLHGQPEDIMLAVYEAHPMLASASSLSSQLQALPRLAHAAVCQHAIKLPDHGDWDNETPLGAYLEIDLQEPCTAMAVADVLPQVLRRRPDVSIKLQENNVAQQAQEAEACVLSALAALTALRRLTIAGNDGHSRERTPKWLQCSHAGEPQLPPALCGLSSLEQLRVQDLCARQPEGQAGWNGRALRPLLAGCPQLTLLQLSNCHLRACDLQVLHAPLAAMTGLQDLSLDSGGSAATAPVCAALRKLLRLTKVCLYGNAVLSTDELWSAIAPLSSLQQMHVAYSDFWESECALIPRLAQLTALTWLSIDDVSPFDGARAASVLSQLVWLRKVELDCDCDNGPIALDVHVCALAAGLAHLSALRELRLNECGAQRPGIAALGSAIARMRALTSLKLGCQSLSRLAAGLGGQLQDLPELVRASLMPECTSRTPLYEVQRLCFPPGCDLSVGIAMRGGSDEHGSYTLDGDYSDADSEPLDSDEDNL